MQLICGHDGIGRHARFRFSWSNPLGFESPCPHQIRTQSLIQSVSVIASFIFAHFPDSNGIFITFLAEMQSKICCILPICALQMTYTLWLYPLKSFFCRGIRFLAEYSFFCHEVQSDSPPPREYASGRQSWRRSFRAHKA